MTGGGSSGGFRFAGDRDSVAECRAFDDFQRLRTARCRERRLESLSEAERAGADDDLWRDDETALLRIDAPRLRALRALAHAGLKADQLFLALRRRRIVVGVETRLEPFDRLRGEPFCRRISVRGSSISLLTEGDNSITIHGATSKVRVGWTPNPFRRSPHAVVTHFRP